MADLERPKIKVGFIPIIDCAAIVLAEELGAYERQGLEVEIRREVSWANVRDKLALGALDASHILAPLPLALTLGIDSVSVPVINAMTLQVNGNALTLSKSLWQEMEETAPQFVGDGRTPLDARAIAAVVAKRAASGAKPLVLASVFPYSVQNYMLRLWLSSAGLDPDRDVRLAVVPPPHTVAYLSGGVIDGYCVGEPWNQQSEALGIGRIALTGPDIWKGMPEKVLGTTESWAANNPQTLKALIKALIEACLWLDEPANRAEAARILSSPRYLNMPAEVMSRTLDLPDFHVFQRNAANFPTGSWRRWCAGSRRRATPTSRPSPIASIAPTSTAPRRATWESNAPMSTACRPAAMASLFCWQATTSLRPRRLPASCAAPTR
jgi:nitrate/nitrite transport system substrate-binding protein